MPHNAVIIDAATRFLRGNPELLAFARRGAGETGQSVEDLLADTVRRVRRSGFEAIAEKEVLAGPPYRLDHRPQQRIGSGGPAVDDARPRLMVVASANAGSNGQEEFVHRAIS